METAGVILYAFEKSCWLSATPTRPRESMYSRGLPTGTAENVFTNGKVNGFPPIVKLTESPKV